MQAPMQLLGPNQQNAQMLPVPLTVNSGESSSQGSSEMQSNSTSESRVSLDSYGEADTIGYGRSAGTSITEGLSEVFVPVIEWLPSARYSLEELMHRAQGAMMNLRARSCLVKIAGEAPFIARTEDLLPAFRSTYFKRLMLPRYRQIIEQRSYYLLPNSDVDAAVAARMKTMLEPTPFSRSAEADFGPAPLPIVDTPADFAADFWKRRAPPLPDPPKPRPKSGRKPLGELPPGADRFRIVDGGKDDGVDKPKGG